MEIKLGKIIFNYNYNKYLNGFLGEAEFYINSYFLRKMYEDLDTLPYLIDYDEEILEKIKQKDKEIYINNIDFLIVFINYSFNKRFTKKLVIAYHGLTNFWIYHDYLHAKNDVTLCEVYVDKYVEKERLEQVFKNKKWINSCNLDFSFIENLEETYFSRWKTSLNSTIIKKYKESLLTY